MVLSGKTGARHLRCQAPSGKKTAIYRVLDANVNRAREGLRVLEDTARFVWEAPGLFGAFRRLRHDVDRVARKAYPKLVAARDSGTDRGRRMKENSRRDRKGLVPANMKRVGEALRVMEEYGKVFSPGAARRFKSLRYRLYGVEKDALSR
jgi:thiamine-phosphate pyrophosphorylase